MGYTVGRLTTTTTGSDSLRWSRRLTKLVWICSKNGPSDGPLPNRDSVPKRVNAAARTAGAGCTVYRQRGGRLYYGSN